MVIRCKISPTCTPHADHHAGRLLLPEPGQLYHDAINHFALRGELSHQRSESGAANHRIESMLGEYLDSATTTSNSGACRLAFFSTDVPAKNRTCGIKPEGLKWFGLLSGSGREPESVPDCRSDMARRATR